MHLTPRELDKLLIHMLAEVALKRKEQGLKLNHPVRSPLTVKTLVVASLHQPLGQGTVFAEARQFR